MTGSICRGEAALGDFADVAVSGTYRLIYIVFNTLFNLLTQEEQVRCFESAASHLTEDGVFIIEGGLPTVFCGLPNNQYVALEGLNADYVALDVARYNPVTQLLEEIHLNLLSGGTHLGPIVTPYAWPSALDLMARLAGLQRGPAPKVRRSAPLRPHGPAQVRDQCDAIMAIAECERIGTKPT